MNTAFKQTLEPAPPAPDFQILPTPAPPNPASSDQHPASNLAPPGATSIQNPVSRNQHPDRPRTRNGKIARLPKPQRDLVNRMLQNNIHQQKIVGALDEIGITITQRNVSNWKTRGGYKEWCREENHAVQTRLLQDHLTEFLRKDDASEVPEVGLQLAATQLSEFLLTPEARQQLAAAPEKYGRMIATLCRLTGQIHALQKYRDESAKQLGRDHNPERLRRETEAELEAVRKTYSSFIPKNCPIDPEVPHRNFIPKSR